MNYSKDAVDCPYCGRDFKGHCVHDLEDGPKDMMVKCTKCRRLFTLRLTYKYSARKINKRVKTRKRKQVEKDTHTEHCCTKHGCKYRDPDCPVVNKQKPQSGPCEQCGLEQAGYFNG